MQIDTQAVPSDLPLPQGLGLSSTTSTGPPSYTILRIKRKRNEEPLDALVVESRVRRKKSRGGIGVFQYAQTVEDDVWKDENRQKDIQEKISHLARETAAKMELSATLPLIPEAPPSPVSRRTQEDIARRYTIVEQAETNQTPRRFPTAPPKVLSSKDLAKKSQADFKMYDAVPTNEQPTSQQEPSEMDKFLPMLNDYLKIHNSDPPSRPASSSNKAISKSNETKVNSQPSDDDYVWDVFYHRPATLNEWNEVSNVASVTGLPPSFGDGYDSASDSEEELDEADEDSNAEEYYKNDYPEDEDESESGDEFHDSSDYDDMMEYHNNAEQFNF